MCVGGSGSVGSSVFVPATKEAIAVATSPMHRNIGSAQPVLFSYLVGVEGSTVALTMCRASKHCELGCVCVGAGGICMLW